MSAWRCLVLTADGRSDWREVEARDRWDAVSQLTIEGLTPLDVRTGTPGLIEKLNQPMDFGRKLRLSEQSLILTQMATLVETGLPVDRSLDLLRDQAPRARQRDLLGMALTMVRGGSGLAAAFEGLKCFPDYVIGVLRAAERSGKLGQALRSVADRLNRSAATRQQLITALTYPAAVLTATVLALVLVLTTVVPQFASVFEGEEARLPTLTRFVLALSAAATAHGLSFALFGTLTLIGMWLWLRSSSGRAFLRKHGRSIPGAGLRDQHLAAPFTGVFATLIHNGLTAIAALPLARASVGSVAWRDGLMRAEQQIREGSRLSAALAATELMPSTAVRLIEVGERSGRLAQTCARASDILGQAAKARVDRIVSLANPLAIITLGGLVGLLVAGVMLGIFAIGDIAG